MARRKKKRPLTDRLAELPLVALGGMLNGSARLAGWAFERYRQAPVTNTAIGLLVLASALSAENALFGQQHRHPAPLFGAVSAPAPAPVVPKLRPKPTAIAPKPQPAAAAAPKPTPAEIASDAAEPAGPTGNPDVFEVQRKLEKLKLFTGTVDGYYGPETAGAIRKFETLNGLPQTGKLSAELIARIKAAPLSLGDQREAPITAAPAPTPAEPQDEVETAAVTLPAAAPAPVSKDLPEPTPLATTLAKAQPALPSPADGTSLAPPEAPVAAAPPTVTSSGDPNDPAFIAKIQRGLASLGFLHGPTDGVAGEATAKAIRNFETYFNYKVTGRITPELLNLLIENGATI